jgi:3-hydroxyisobutyrate dehydrogenase-like beta-hydroxyacid dehydrogenase
LPRDRDYLARAAISVKEDQKMDVGFIGLGHMGAPMARNLLKAGHRVTVYNRTRGKAEALAREGAQVAERVADACHGDVLITMLSDDAAVEDVVFSEGGALNALGRNAIHISMSTISVALSDRLAEAHGKAGQGYVAAPVFGRPEAAAAARLFIIAAGADATIARCQPLFDDMGQQTFVISAKPSEATDRTVFHAPGSRMQQTDTFGRGVLSPCAEATGAAVEADSSYSHPEAQPA